MRPAGRRLRTAALEHVKTYSALCSPKVSCTYCSANKSAQVSKYASASVEWDYMWVLSNQTKSQIVCFCCKTFAVIYISTPPPLFPREFHSIVKALKVCVPFDCVMSCHCTFWHACDRYLPHIVFNQCVLCMFRNYFYLEIYFF